MNLNKGLERLFSDEEVSKPINDPLFADIKEGLKAVITAAYSKGFEDATNKQPVPQGLNARMTADIEFYSTLYQNTQTSKFKHLLNSVQIALIEAKDEFELEQLNKSDESNPDRRYQQ